MISLEIIISTVVNMKALLIALVFVFGFVDSFNGFASLRKSILSSSKRVFTAAPIVITSALSLRLPSPLLKPENKPSIEKIVPNEQRTAFDDRDLHKGGIQFLFVRNAAQHVGPSVVRIDCDREVSPLMSLFSDTFKEGDVVKVSGTGIIASSDGYILTNAHVVDQAKRVSITLSNGRTFKATVIAQDELTDLAVIKVDVGGEYGCALTRAPLGDSDSLHAGDWVIAVGCPVGLDFTVTLGVVSSPKRSAAEVGAPQLKGSYIQTDAALNSGNSGGPLVNDRGEVVGINTMVRTNTEAIGFAIPINRATQIYEILRTGKKPTHAYFGTEVISITPDKVRIHNEDPNVQRLIEIHGALVKRIVPGSPADKSGLRKNDIIVSVNGAKIRTAEELEDVFDRCRTGAPSVVQIVRGEAGKRMDLEATPQDLHVLLEEKKKLLPQPMIVIKP